MTSQRPIWQSMLETIVWIVVGGFVFLYFPMSSVFHQPTTQRVGLAFAFFVWLLANVVLSWIELKNRFVSNMLNRLLGGLGMILILWYCSVRDT